MAILFLLASPWALAGGLSSNDYVRLEVRPVSATMHPGASGAVELLFFPADGIHVNVNPPVVFSLDSGTAVILKGKPVMKTDPNTGYLSAATPVKQEIMVGKNAPGGQLTVKGTVAYFFCSDSEGWCNRQRDPVEFTIVVRP